MEESTVILRKIKRYLRREDKAYDKQGVAILWDIKLYSNTCA